MKISMLLLLCYSLFTMQLQAQIDTTLRQFYPLGLGDLWQYRNQQGNLYPNKHVVNDDTLMPNGAHYAAIGSPAPPYVYDRIDDNLRAQWYAPWATSDTCGGSFPQEASVYRLGEDSGAVWRDCYNWNGFLGPPLIRYAGIQWRNVFGQMRQTMIFEHGHVIPETGDTVFGTQDWLVRGIGLYYRQYWWSGGWEILTGALINGDTLGLIVSVAEYHEDLPQKVNLHQNYPNPFNAKTTIEFDLPFDYTLSLKVYDILGQELATLLNEPRAAGHHRVEWDAGTYASGVYFYRLLAGGTSFSRKMILQK